MRAAMLDAARSLMETPGALEGLMSDPSLAAMMQSMMGGRARPPQ